MSGNGYDGTVNGPTLGADRQGTASMAYSFDGVDDYISIPDLLDNKLDLTISAWVNVNSLSNPFNEIVSKELVSGLAITNTGFLHENTSADGLSWSGGLNSNSTLNLNKWYFVSTTHDSSNSKLYINGILDKASALDKSKGTNGFTTSIGAKNDGMSYIHQFHGLIDEFRIYSRTLSGKRNLRAL